MPTGILIGILFIVVSLVLLIFVLFINNSKNNDSVGFKNLSTKSKDDNQFDDIENRINSFFMLKADSNAMLSGSQ